jgi:hypothetical protein
MSWRIVRQKMLPELATELKKSAAFIGAVLTGAVSTALLVKTQILGFEKV